jgi:hypothetical protein
MIIQILAIIVTIITIGIVAWAFFIAFIEMMIKDYSDEEKDTIRQNLFK